MAPHSPPISKTLADHTSLDLIIPQLLGRDPPSVIQELTRALYSVGRIADTLSFYHAALNMETLHSSAMDYGIAFPHARVHDVDKVCFALGRSFPDPVRWPDAGRIREVHLVFLMALPADTAADYVPVVLSVGHLHGEPAIMSRLLGGGTAADILAALERVPLNHSASRLRC